MTLGFIAEATFRTVPVLPQVATGLLVFDSIERANGLGIAEDFSFDVDARLAL